MSKGYKDLLVWQKAKTFCVKIYKITEKFPKTEIYGLTSQLRRASISIPSNIAEGSRRAHNKEQIQFYMVAYGSGAEIETQLEIAKDLFPYLSDEIIILEEQLDEIMKMLNKLINSKKLQTINYKLPTGKGFPGSESSAATPSRFDILNFFIFKRQNSLGKTLLKGRRYEKRSARSTTGFTLIETLVIVIITIILSSIMITYSHIGEKQIVLFRDQAKVVEVLNRAKFLAVQLYKPEAFIQLYQQMNVEVKICGYGVHIDKDNGKFYLFRDLKFSGAFTLECDNQLNMTGGNLYGTPSNPYGYDEVVEEFSLDPRLKFDSSGTTLSDIVFIPPDPTIKMTPNATEATIKIVDKVNSSNNKVIKVNNFGQITAQ